MYMYIYVNAFYYFWRRLSGVRDVLAPPVWRDRFGAGVLAPTVLAHGRFGAGRFGATEQIPYKPERVGLKKHYSSFIIPASSYAIIFIHLAYSQVRILSSFQLILKQRYFNPSSFQLGKNSFTIPGSTSAVIFIHPTSSQVGILSSLHRLFKQLYFHPYSFQLGKNSFIIPAST